MKIKFSEQAIHDETGKLIGIVERQPRVRHYTAHSLHVVDPRGKKFAIKWQAASWIHAVHDNARDCTT